uniref:Uncharacterized protein n=1 Tax=Neisseria meningitidis alpha275 TaxID=295996 RepID=C6SL97_NEIME|nr:hypothetical protein predicted by Glimmer/Critica [Neisseria meningitidis alpha275]
MDEQSERHPHADVISRMNAAAVMVSQNLGVFDAVCVIMCILSRLSLRIL